MALSQYDSPGYLPDFAGIPGQPAAWSAAVSAWFDGNIELARQKLKTGEQPQFYNQLTTTPSGPVFEQPFVWNGLPGTYRSRYGRLKAFPLADQLLPLTQRMDGPGSYYVGPQWESLYYRPNDEYCEWHVDRNADGKIRRITFTSEPPEYWQALHGDTLQDVSGNWSLSFPGDPDLLLSLYRELVSPDVQLPDLVCAEDLVDLSTGTPEVVYPKGAYNPYNRWNTTDGIVHLTHPANSLSAEINLGALATVLRATPDGVPITDPDALICAAGYGGVNRCSDPTIGSSVNELAALGFAVSLRNPVGLSMNHLDLAGFTTPRGEPVPPEFFRVIRGDAKLGLIERAVFEVPAGEGYVVGDISIGGVPISYGGQIAEHITVNFVGMAAAPDSFHNTPVPPQTSCCQSEQEGGWLRYAPATGPCYPGFEPAFAYGGPVPVQLLDAPPPPTRRGRHKTRAV
ncbi:MAG: hypothetical protein JO144_02415 [Actinobacteria bacterium]|nr:hypothetical protein [Actinomycetota bacterium]